MDHQELAKLAATAKSILRDNQTSQFTKPAPGLYPHQCNWDTGFIALGYAHFDPERARIELRSLFRGQWANGMLPQIIFGEDANASYFPGPDFWQTERARYAPPAPRTSGITMPPVQGFILWEIYKLTQDTPESLVFLKEMYPKVLALHRYLYNNRDPLEEGLVYICHPWESGTDNSPTWDSVLARMDIAQLPIPPYERRDLQNPQAAKHRPTQADYDHYAYLVDLFRKHQYEDAAIYRECPFLVQDPLFNAALVWSNEALIQIGGLLEEDVLEVIQWNELTIYSMNEKLWDEEAGIYNAFDLRAATLIPIETNSGLLPMMGEIPTQEQAELMLSLLESAHFGGEDSEIRLCPTYRLTAEDINFERCWRGPVWVHMNWMLYRGLLRYDMEEMAEKIRTQTLALLLRQGFFEYFDPRISIEKGGYGADHFSSSAALCLDFLNHQL